MPVIHGETNRDVRILPALSTHQAVELLITGALAWLVVHVPGPVWWRATLGLTVGCGGVTYALARWPLGPAGERLGVWGGRALRFALRPRSLAGASVPGWDGVLDIRQDHVRHASGWSAALEWAGGDPAMGGEGAAAAAQAVFRELLHALPGGLQVVGLARRVTPADRPRAWDPERVPAPLGGLARAYADHWAHLVDTHALVARRTLVVVTVSGPAPLALPRLEVAVRAAAQCAARLGLSARRLSASEWIGLLRAEAGAWDPRPGPCASEWPLVVRGHG